MDHITAKVSCFARAYHYRNNDLHIFADDKAQQLLGDDYELIARSMSQGISFFLPDFQGSTEEGLQLIVNRQLSPSVLGRSAFCEEMLQKAVDEGITQYVIFAAGYDTYGIRNRDPFLSVFKLDLPEVLEDKASRIEKAGLHENSIRVPCDLSKASWREMLIQKGFDSNERSFGSLLGISYYLDKTEFEDLLMAHGEIIPEGSAICLDYPSDDESRETRVNRELASAAHEEMKAKYSYGDMKTLLEGCGFQITRLLTHDEMTEQYFSCFNSANPDHRIEAPEGINYVLAVRTRPEEG